MVDQVIAIIGETLASFFTSLWARFGDLDQYLGDLGGINTRYVTYILLAVVALMVIAKLLKFSFAILQKVVLPAAVVAWVAGTYLHFPFFAIFPVLVGLGSAWMIFKP